MVGPVRRGGRGSTRARTMDRPNSSRNQGPNGSDQDQNGSDGSRVHEGFPTLASWEKGWGEIHGVSPGFVTDFWIGSNSHGKIHIPKFEKLTILSPQNLQDITCKLHTNPFFFCAGDF